MSRLFVAIDVPADVRRALVALKRPIRGARWVPEDQLHLTLRFIGDADPSRQRDIEAELARIAAPAPSIAVFGCGSFPNDRRPHVLWAGVKPIGELIHLAEAVDRAVIAAGVAAERKPFSPHITLARLKEAAPGEVKAMLSEQADLASRVFEITEMVLYSSVLSSQGAKHAVERRFSLSGAR